MCILSCRSLYHVLGTPVDLTPCCWNTRRSAPADEFELKDYMECSKPTATCCGMILSFMWV